MSLPKLSLPHLLGGSSVCLAVWLVPLASQALTVQVVPNPRWVSGGWVTDMANVLKPETETQLNQMLTQLEAKNGAEMAVVTVPQTTPALTPKVFATQLFNYWGIGKRGKNNGVLFLISVGDRRVEVETGSGLEAILPDTKTSQILSTQVTPRFKQGNFDGGTVAGTRTIVLALESGLARPTDAVIRDATVAQSALKPGASVKGPEKAVESTTRYDFWGLFLVLVMILARAIPWGRGGANSCGDDDGVSSGSDSSDSGSGSDFGGGDSGGGGAGDSW